MPEASPPIVVLEAIGGAIRLERAAESAPGIVWTRCHLVAADGRSATFLGAEALDIIAGRLVAQLLDADRPPTSTIGTRPVRWVLSLAEAHHQLYVAWEGTERILQWRDGHGHPLEPVLRLSEDGFRQWRAQLAPLGRRRSPSG